MTLPVETHRPSSGDGFDCAAMELAELTPMMITDNTIHGSRRCSIVTPSERIQSSPPLASTPWW
jgi:hypothetical protein